jgi:hypothetical protein
LQAGQALGDEAFAPLADGVPVAIQLRGQLLIGGGVVRRRVQDEATAEGEGLGGGTRPRQGLELVAKVRGQDNARGERPWHDVPPCTQGDDKITQEVIMARLGTIVQTLAANL